MNATFDGVEPPYTIDTGKPQGQGGDAYMFVLGFFCIVVFLVILTYTSYICKRSEESHSPPISFAAAIYDGADNRHLITFSRGLDDDVLVTFPTFLYSEATKAQHKGDHTANYGSGCSICLADYKPADVVRLLPECNHLFHVKCIDTWLKVHPTCPMCRNSPLAIQQS